MVARDPLVRSGLSAVLAAYPGLVLREVRAGIDGDVADVVVWDEPDGSPAAGAAILALVGAPEQARKALQEGALGALSRSAPPDAIAPAALAVAAGHYVLDARFMSALIPLGPEASSGAGADLSPREREVLALLAEGLSNRELGDRLGISRHTAKFHVNAILDKLGATTRTEAVVLAARTGLLSL